MLRTSSILKKKSNEASNLENQPQRRISAYISIKALKINIGQQ